LTGNALSASLDVERRLTLEVSLRCHSGAKSAGCKLRRSRQMVKKMPELSLSVLVYVEDKYKVAHCLEMDIKGRGANEDEAMEELLSLIEAQVSFAYQKGEPGLIYHPAEQRYFDIFRDLQVKILSSYPKPPKPDRNKKYTIRSTPMPQPCACFAM